MKEGEKSLWNDLRATGGLKRLPGRSPTPAPQNIVPLSLQLERSLEVLRVHSHTHSHSLSPLFYRKEDLSPVQKNGTGSILQLTVGRNPPRLLVVKVCLYLVWWIPAGFWPHKGFLFLKKNLKSNVFLKTHKWCLPVLIKMPFSNINSDSLFWTF